MGKKSLSLLILGLTIILLSGCWSKKELTEISIVTAVGIDKGKDTKYEVTFQIINPKNVTGGQQQGGQTGPAFNIFKVNANSLEESGSMTNQRLSRILYFDHANLIVIGEELAKEGIFGLLDIFERSPDFRNTAQIVIAKGSTAHDVMSTLSPVDQINANKITMMLEHSEKLWGENISLNINELILDLFLEGSNPVISGVGIIGEKSKASQEDNIKSSEPLAQVNIDDIAVFKEDQLYDWISGPEAKGTMWIRDRVKTTVLNLDWKEIKGAISILTQRGKSKINIEIKDRKPIITILVRAEGSITEVTTAIDLANPDVILQIQSLMKEEIEYDIHAALKYAQEEKLDIFGLGEKIRAYDPNYWKTIEKDWNEKIFPEIEIKVLAEGFVRRTNLKVKPFFYDKPKMQPDKGAE